MRLSVAGGDEGLRSRAAGGSVGCSWKSVATPLGLGLAYLET